MKYLNLLFLLSCGQVACNSHEDCPPDHGYTVMFLPDKNKVDTTYLLNRVAISYKKAKEIAKGYPGEARPILYDSVWGKYKKH